MERKFKLLIALAIMTSLLAACQSAIPDEARLAVGWEPTPVGDRPVAPEPTPFVSEEEPLPEVSPREIPQSNEVIPTLAPTLVPEGVHIKETDGFTFYYPIDWELLSEEGESLTLRDPDLGVFFSVTSGFKDDETDFESYKEEFTSEEMMTVWGMTETELIMEEDVVFAGDLTAQTATFATVGEDGRETDLWIAYAESETREFVFISFAEPGIFEARKATMTQMMAQAEVGEIRLFGLDRENTLVTLGGDPTERSMDPARTGGSAAGTVGMIYSGLVRMSPALRVEGDLAESWSISDDGTTYTFTLRDGLTFGSGERLTADDVKASWDRAANPETDSTTVVTYLGDIEGVKAVADGEADEISGVTVIDDQTIEVKLDGPKPYFLAKLTYPVSFVVNVDAVDPESDEWVFEPDSSGPFLLDDYREGEAMIFSSNSSYYAPPALSGIVELIGRVGSGLSLFEAGEIDVVGMGSADAKEVAKPSHELHEQWQSTTSMCTTLLQMSNSNAPFDDLNVRKAFALAVDKEGLNDVLSEGANLVAGSIFPPAMPGYSAELASVYSTSFDPEAAQAALAESAYGTNLPPVVISAGGFGDSERDDLNAMIEKWREVLGVDVTISFVDPINFSEALKEEESQMVSYGWCADYPDPENFLDVLYHTESEFNVSGYSNAEIDALLEEARVELDTGRRLSLYQEIEEMLLEDSAAIPLSHGVRDIVVNPRLDGYVLAPMGAPIMHLLSFSEDTGEN